MDLNNKGQLVGVIASENSSHYEVEGEVFHEILLNVSRLSSVVDTIPVTISDKLVKSKNIDLSEGKKLAITGEFRSYNKIVEGRSKLCLHFFVKDFKEEVEVDAQEANTVELTGFICKPPVYRETPFKREICDVLLAINRPAGKSDYIPCILWGRNARFMKDAPVGTKLNLIGRMQSRGYKKTLLNGDVEERTAYEVSCQSVAIVEDERKDEQTA